MVLLALLKYWLKYNFNRVTRTNRNSKCWEPFNNYERMRASLSIILAIILASGNM